MRFAGLLKQSLIDYPGEIAAVLFTRGCNLMCPFCHNAHLLYRRNEGSDISLEEVMSFLAERRGFLDAVVISGGEPTLHPGLVEAVAAINRLGYKVKLDTNGSNCGMLEALLEGEMLHYVAMDIKAPVDYKKYSHACGGRLGPQDFLNVRNSIRLLLESAAEIEFRTTVVPALHGLKDIMDIAGSIQGARLYTLQQFNPQNTLDPVLAGTMPYSIEAIEEMARQCEPLVERVRVVNL